jgi:hypothetical protein
MAQMAIQDQQERKVEVNRTKLIETLKTNREKHGRDYKAALDGYKEMAQAELKKAYDRAKVKLEERYTDGMTKLDRFDPADPSNFGDSMTLIDAFHIQLKVPRNFTNKYDAAIDMAEWDVRETLELTHAEFQCFVRDVWQWSNEFHFINKTYTDFAAGSRR